MIAEASYSLLMTTTGQTGAFKTRLTQRFLEIAKMVEAKACG
jgi:hypothetical protein